MLMAVGGLLRAGAVDWITAMTYQSASGAGAKHMRELLEANGRSASLGLVSVARSRFRNLDIDRAVSAALESPSSRARISACLLAASLIPGSDRDLGTGQSREEWKAGAEANKILGTEAHPIPMEGICVRVSAMRCHFQALTIKLKQDLPLAEVERYRRRQPWVRVVPMTAVLDRELSPAAGQRRFERTHRPACANSRWAGNIYPPSPWAISCCGARRSRLRRTMRFLLPHA